jgi:delta 1-pyrroline-5-carboxylate dehydrogenase
MQEKLTDVQKKHEKEKNKSNRLRESKENALENFESLNKQLEDIKKKYDEEKYLSDRLKKSKENAIQNVVELNKQVGELNELKIQIEENAELLNQRQRNTINVLNSELDMKQIEIDETSIQLADAESKMNIYQKMIRNVYSFIRVLVKIVAFFFFEKYLFIF